MATSYTHNAFLQKPATSDRLWDVPLNANSDYLDALSAIGQLLVTSAEMPSSTLNIRVTSGSYVKADGTVATYAGTAAFLIQASQTLSIWLTDAGVLTTGASFPTTAHVRLAIVSTNASSIVSISDSRVASKTAGTGLGFVLKSGDSVNGIFSVASTTASTPTFTVNPSTSSIGFFGATPAAQAPALVPLTDNTTGTAGSVLTDVGTTFSQATLDANFATLAAKVNALIAAMKRNGLMSN